MSTLEGAVRGSQAIVERGASRRAYDLLAQAARAVHARPDPEAQRAWVAEASRSVTDAAWGAYVCADETGELQAVTAASELGMEPTVRDLTGLYEVAERSGGALLLEDARLDSRFQDVDGARVASFLAVEVQGADNEPHGKLLLGHPERDCFDDEDQAVVEALAYHLGVAMDNVAAITEMEEVQAAQREVVNQLQDAVRPPMPKAPAAELGVHYQPADSSAPTGGDLYDWAVLPDGDVHLVVVDIMGKGVAATKDALAVTHALRMLVLDGCPLERLVARADTLVTAHRPDLVATLLVARYSPDSGLVRIAGGGHPPALVVSADRVVTEVTAHGIPIGWPGAGTLEVAEVSLQRSETLVFYTDGLVEAGKDIVAGLGALERAAAETARYPAPLMARALVDRALAGAARQDDSLALVLRRRTPPAISGSRPLGPFEYRFSPNLAAVPLVRGSLADWLDHQPIDGEDVEDLLLVASELATNAVRHAGGAPTGLSLRARAADDAVVIEVEDDGGEAILHWNDLERPEPEAEKGRGLWLVEALTDELTTETRGGRTLVRCVKGAVFASAPGLVEHR